VWSPADHPQLLRCHLQKLRGPTEGEGAWGTQACRWEAVRQAGEGNKGGQPNRVLKSLPSDADALRTRSASAHM
jgi:hypothetical protein